MLPETALRGNSYPVEPGVFREVALLCNAGGLLTRSARLIREYPLPLLVLFLEVLSGLDGGAKIISADGARLD